jgi:Flp pilus assembly pilin Flp
MKPTKNQKGAAFIEYVVAIAGMIGVFVIIGIVLELTAVKVAKRSVDTVRTDVPCKSGGDGILTDDQCK